MSTVTNDPKGALLTGEPLSLAELLQNALGCNRPAAIGDKLGLGETATSQTDRGGWWAARDFGARLWELYRTGKMLPETASTARAYIAEALKGYQAAGILGDVEISVAMVGARLEAEIIHHPPQGTPESIRYADLWDFVR